MKSASVFSGRNTLSSGFTLVELLVAMTLGLLISYFVSDILVASNRNSSVSRDLSQAQEAGRFAISFLNRSLMKAGYGPDGALDQPYEPLCSGSAGMCTTDSSSNDTGDRIAIRRTATTENNLSCQNTNLGVADGTEVTDVFWVEDVDGTPTLICRTYDSLNATPITSAESLVSGVEALQALYGISLCDPTETGSRNVSTYLSATEIDSPPSSFSSATCPDGSSAQVSWQRVYAVKIAVLTRAADPTSGAATERGYTLLDAAPYSFDDRYTRQVFSTTVTRANY
ncbi:MAG: hypothetical protein CMI00_07280 [Oceanospirillaceae bacterium]|nr:hypothetical protein [Oceanospirillaceae bacterium]|tara:strand:+ start:2811 stop:3662 length:852 start_codon:yes stop_codon:yes gene_type:complete